MRYLKFKELFKKFTIFSINEIRKIDSSFFGARLNEWQKKGYIKKITKGYYIFSDLEINDNILFEISNKVYKPSYISFESAFSYYNLIPESVYAVTASSSRKSLRIETPVSKFIYHKLKPNLFFGYKIVDYKNNHFMMANIEKAVLDYFYINPRIKCEDDFDSLRINKEALFEQTDDKKILTCLNEFKQKTLYERINSFLRFMKNA